MQYNKQHITVVYDTEKLNDSEKTTLNQNTLAMFDSHKIIAMAKGNAMNLCEWQFIQDIYDEYYLTECGKTSHFSCGDVRGNEYEYCPYCGGKIQEIDFDSNFGRK